MTSEKKITPKKKLASAEHYDGSASGLTKVEAKKALDITTRAIKALKRQAEKNFWQIGRRLNTIAELELYKAAGFATIGDYAEQVLDISRSTAFSYMRIAAAFSETVAVAFGPPKLDKGLAYIAVTPEKETARDIPTLRIRVPDAKGRIHEMPFAEVTTRELQAAASHERLAHGGKRSKRSPAVSPEISRCVAKANGALDRAVGKSNAALADVTVRTHDGEVLIDVRGVPVGDLDKALSAVIKAFG